MTFETEDDLVSSFLASLDEVRPWGILETSREFYYGRGRTDIIGVLNGGEVVAFEAKLERWKEALQQAYRNTCFAHRSYVLLPWPEAQKASRFEADFEMRGVGLCTLVEGEILVLFEPPRSQPIQPWLAARALAACLGVGSESPCPTT